MIMILRTKILPNRQSPTDINSPRLPMRLLRQSQQFERRADSSDDEDSVDSSDEYMLIVTKNRSSSASPTPNNNGRGSPSNLSSVSKDNPSETDDNRTGVKNPKKNKGIKSSDADSDNDTAKESGKDKDDKKKKKSLRQEDDVGVQKRKRRDLVVTDAEKGILDKLMDGSASLADLELQTLKKKKKKF